MSFFSLPLGSRFASMDSPRRTRNGSTLIPPPWRAFSLRGFSAAGKAAVTAEDDARERRWPTYRRTVLRRQARKRKIRCVNRIAGSARPPTRAEPGRARSADWFGQDFFGKLSPMNPKHKSTRLEVLKILEEHASQPDQVKWRQTTKPSKGSPFDK